MLWRQSSKHVVEDMKIPLASILLHHSWLLQQILTQLGTSHCTQGGNRVYFAQGHTKLTELPTSLHYWEKHGVAWNKSCIQLLWAAQHAGNGLLHASHVLKDIYSPPLITTESSDTTDISPASSPQYSSLTPTSFKPRSHLKAVAAIEFSLHAHPFHKESSNKILPSLSSSYSVHSLNCPWLYLYCSGNAAVCIFQSGCCCHSSQSGHCQKLQAMGLPTRRTQTENAFFKLSDPIQLVWKGLALAFSA